MVRREDVLARLAVDRMNPSSIAYALTAARENARRAREIVSTELWETLNTTNARMPRRLQTEKVHEFFQWVRERSALAVGIVDSSTSRDEAWQFFTLGRSIERADMTARLLATRSLTEASGPSWTTILRSCGAYEAYLRTYRGMPSARNAAEFLLLDRLFPRSIIYSIQRAEDCMSAIDPRADRVGHSNTVLRALGQIRNDLEYRPISEILGELPPHMDRVQTVTREASEAIRGPVLPDPGRAELDRRDLMKRLRIEHQTGFSYQGDVSASYNEARMLPGLDRQSVRAQLVARHRAVDIRQPVRRLLRHARRGLRRAVAARRADDHRPLAGRGAPAPARAHRPHVGRARPRVGPLDRDGRAAVADRAHAPASRGRRARPHHRRSSTTIPAARRTRSRSRSATRWSTCTASPACTRPRSEAWEARKGVCQDIAHITLGALREVGIPARYVSGYLHPRPTAEVGVAVTGESHAWVEWFAGEWQGFDPTNNIEIGDRHVLVGRGRDYGDVPPLRGVYAGPFKSNLHVKVTITREA